MVGRPVPFLDGIGPICARVAYRLRDSLNRVVVLLPTAAFRNYALVVVVWRMICRQRFLSLRRVCCLHLPCHIHLLLTKLWQHKFALSISKGILGNWKFTFGDHGASHGHFIISPVLFLNLIEMHALNLTLDLKLLLLMLLPLLKGANGRFDLAKFLEYFAIPLSDSDNFELALAHIEGASHAHGLEAKAYRVIAFAHY